MADAAFFGPCVTLTVAELAKRAGCRDVTFPERTVAGAAPLEEAGDLDLSFLTGAAYRPLLRATKAGAVIVPPAFVKDVPEGTAVLVSDQVMLSFGRATRALYPEAPVSSGNAEHAKSSVISPQAVVSPSATVSQGCKVEAFAFIEEGASLGEGCLIGPGAFIGRGVRLGARCVVGPSASLRCTVAGDDCVIQAGARLGEEGFGFAFDPANGRYESLPHLGRVVLGHRVYVGAGSCIARGSVKDTLIEDDARIDNLVQIGHNCRVGRGSILAGQAGIAGSSDIGRYCLIGGQAGLAGHLSIGDKTTLAAQTGVASSLEGNAVYGGSPAVPAAIWRRQSAYLKRAVVSKKEGSSEA